MTRTDITPDAPALRLTCAAAPRGIASPRVQILALSCACAGASAVLFALDPSRHAVYPQCLLYRATGLYCAGCGATRALYALLHGRVFAALHDNALFVLLLPLAISMLGRYVQRAWLADQWPAISGDSAKILRSGLACFVVIAVFMIARNLPGLPFEWLRPSP